MGVRQELLGSTAIYRRRTWWRVKQSSKRLAVRRFTIASDSSILPRLRTRHFRLGQNVHNNHFTFFWHFVTQLGSSCRVIPHNHRLWRVYMYICDDRFWCNSLLQFCRQCCSIVHTNIKLKWKLAGLFISNLSVQYHKLLQFGTDHLICKRRLWFCSEARGFSCGMEAKK